MKVDFIIDGASVGAANGATFARHDPVTGKVASEAAAAGAADVDKVVEAAARAFPAWSETGPERAPRAAATRPRICSKAAPAISQADDRRDRRDRPVGRLQRASSPPRCCAKPRR